MRWTIAQLVKLNESIKVDELVDFSNIAEDHDDIRDISKVKITGTGEVVGQSVIFDLHIECKLTLACAVTLDDVEYPMDIKTKEVFSFADTFDQDDDQEDIIYVKKGGVIDLAPVIWQSIVLEMPLRVVSENAYQKVSKHGKDYEFIVDQKKEKTIDPRFAVLKDYFKDNNK